MEIKIIINNRLLNRGINNKQEKTNQCMNNSSIIITKIKEIIKLINYKIEIVLVKKDKYKSFNFNIQSYQFLIKEYD